MKKSAIAKFLETIGYKVNSEDDLIPIEEEESTDPVLDPETADPAQTVSTTQNAATAQPATTTTVPVTPAAPVPQPKPLPENLAKLNKLMDDIGGFDAFQSLLSATADVIEVSQNKQEEERAQLITALVANSAGSLTEDDLESTDLDTLRMMAKIQAPGPSIDYSILGSRTVRVNEKDIAPAPSFLLSQPATD